MSGVIVFLIVTLILVGMLLFAKAKLTPKGEEFISIAQRWMTLIMAKRNW